MAATTPRVTAFWGAFLNVLIRCIAALGFATPARTKAAASRQAVGYATVPAQAVATPAIPAAAPSGGYAAPPLQAKPGHAARAAAVRAGAFAAADDEAAHQGRSTRHLAQLAQHRRPGGRPR